VGVGVDAVAWGKVGTIVASWVTSPLISGTLAFLVFRIVRATILDQDDPIARARRTGPFFVFVVVFTLALVTVFKGLKNVAWLNLGLGQALLVAGAMGVVGALVGAVILRRVRVPEEDPRRQYLQVEAIFGVLQVMTACAVAFAHGSNDVANAIGPLAAVFKGASAGMAQKAEVAPWMLAIGGLGIVLGLATYGYRVMETVGRKITELTPSRGFSAELAAALTIVIASRLGIPISTTHTLVGAVLGVGLARGIGALDLRVVGSVAVSWVVTLPTGAGLSVFFFYFFKGLLSD
jgi:PiT family inorganic phosphate transporter